MKRVRKASKTNLRRLYEGDKALSKLVFIMSCCSIANKLENRFNYENLQVWQ